MDRHQNETVPPTSRVEILKDTGAHIHIDDDMCVCVVPGDSVVWFNESIVAVMGPARVRVFGEDGKANRAKFITYAL